jgi:hypothetical protein
MNTGAKVPTRTILAAVVMLAGVLLELVFTTLGGRHREAARMK